MSTLASQRFGGVAPVSGVVAVTVVNTMVVGPLDIQPYERFTVYVVNDGGGGGANITGVTVEHSPDSSDAALWQILEAAVGALPLVGAASQTYEAESSGSSKFIRVMAVSAAGGTTARFWVSVGGVA